jgi:hypothetical protein
VLEAVKSLGVSRTENVWHFPRFQLCCDPQRHLAPEIEVEHDAIKLGFSYFLFTGGYGARCAGNHSAKLFHHAVRRHCNDWIVLNDKDARSFQLHSWVSLSWRGTLSGF